MLFNDRPNMALAHARRSFFFSLGLFLSNPPLGENTVRGGLIWDYPALRNSDQSKETLY